MNVPLLISLILFCLLLDFEVEIMLFLQLRFSFLIHFAVGFLIKEWGSSFIRTSLPHAFLVVTTVSSGFQELQWFENKGAGLFQEKAKTIFFRTARIFKAIRLQIIPVLSLTCLPGFLLATFYKMCS